MEIHVKQSSMVRPSKETPKHSLWNSDLDLLVMTTHVPTVYFYRRPSDCSNNFFDAGLLKDALSNLLVSFYPMAGRLGRDGNGRLEILCNAEGVMFVEAETTSSIDDLGEFTPGPKLLPLIPIPKIDYNAPDVSSHPLLVLQVTNFKCGGVCLGVGLHHALADGTSAIHFINTWADIARGLPLSIPPVIDRTIILDYISPSPTFQHIEYHPPPSLIQELQSVSQPTTLVTLKLLLHQINTLKAKVNHVNGTRYSTYEILSAHMWRCTCKARGLSDDQATKLRIPINGRSRLNPPLPSNYFGNVIFFAAPVVSSGEIQSKPLIFTLEKIREALNRIDDEYLRSALAYVSSQDDLMAIKASDRTDNCPNFRVTSWTTMPIYDADFGWGRPMFMGWAGIIHEGGSYILPADSSNDGTLLVMVCLETRHAHLFKKCFYDFSAY